jgi:hypothetical protein
MHGESVDAEVFSYGFTPDLLTALRVTFEPVDNSVTLVRRCASAWCGEADQAGEPRAVSRVCRAGQPTIVRATGRAQSQSQSQQAPTKPAVALSTVVRLQARCRGTAEVASSAPQQGVPQRIRPGPTRRARAIDMGTEASPSRVTALRAGPDDELHRRRGHTVRDSGGGALGKRAVRGALRASVRRPVPVSRPPAGRDDRSCRPAQLRRLRTAVRS